LEKVGWQLTRMNKKGKKEQHTTEGPNGPRGKQNQSTTGKGWPARGWRGWERQIGKAKGEKKTLFLREETNELNE